VPLAVAGATRLVAVEFWAAAKAARPKAAIAVKKRIVKVVGIWSVSTGKGRLVVGIGKECEDHEWISEKNQKSVGEQVKNVAAHSASTRVTQQQMDLQKSSEKKVFRQAQGARDGEVYDAAATPAPAPGQACFGGPGRTGQISPRNRAAQTGVSEWLKRRFLSGPV
jgi:hypothetical protein